MSLEDQILARRMAASQQVYTDKLLETSEPDEPTRYAGYDAAQERHVVNGNSGDPVVVQGSVTNGLIQAGANVKRVGRGLGARIDSMPWIKPKARAIATTRLDLPNVDIVFAARYDEGNGKRLWFHHFNTQADITSTSINISGRLFDLGNYPSKSWTDPSTFVDSDGNRLRRYQAFLSNMGEDLRLGIKYDAIFWNRGTRLLSSATSGTGYVDYTIEEWFNAATISLTEVTQHNTFGLDNLVGDVIGIGSRATFLPTNYRLISAPGQASWCGSGFWATQFIPNVYISLYAAGLTGGDVIQVESFYKNLEINASLVPVGFQAQVSNPSFKNLWFSPGGNAEVVTTIFSSVVSYQPSVFYTTSVPNEVIPNSILDMLRAATTDGQLIGNPIITGTTGSPAIVYQGAYFLSQSTQWSTFLLPDLAWQNNTAHDSRGTGESRFSIMTNSPLPGEPPYLAVYGLQYPYNSSYTYEERTRYSVLVSTTIDRAIARDLEQSYGAAAGSNQTLSTVQYYLVDGAGQFSEINTDPSITIYLEDGQPSGVTPESLYWSWVIDQSVVLAPGGGLDGLFFYEDATSPLWAYLGTQPKIRLDIPSDDYARTKRYGGRVTAYSTEAIGTLLHLTSLTFQVEEVTELDYLAPRAEGDLGTAYLFNGSIRSTPLAEGNLALADEPTEANAGWTFITEELRLYKLNLRFPPDLGDYMDLIVTDYQLIFDDSGDRYDMVETGERFWRTLDPRPQIKELDPNNLFGDIFYSYHPGDRQ